MRVYRLLRPVIGHRAALWLSEMSLGFAVAVGGLMLFWAFFSIFPAAPDGSATRECGIGRYTYDC